MREVVLTVPAAVVEDVLDRVLPVVASGVRETRQGEQVELRMRGHDLPPLEVLDRLAQRWEHTVVEHEVPDDWRLRRLADYRAIVIGERLVVRPDWAPPTPSSEAAIEITLADDGAFGKGTHPTTRAVLEILLDTPPLGAFADLGCGSGVVGILAAKLGWAPVRGVDVVAASVTSARANARHNEVEAEFVVGDLSIEVPLADGFAANIPAPVHRVVARAHELEQARWGVLSGFAPADDDELIAAYAQRGFGVRARRAADDWSVIVVARDD
jgi:ribosomal protein L11 methyltransferase